MLAGYCLLVYYVNHAISDLCMAKVLSLTVVLLAYFLALPRDLVLLPHGKKGVKPVHSSGPFLVGVEPRYQAVSREEVLGEPLASLEVTELVKGKPQGEGAAKYGSVPSAKFY